MNQNSEPFPSSLFTPIISASCREIAKPSPAPPNRRIVDASIRLNFSKSMPIRSFGMPMPRPMAAAPLTNQKKQERPFDVANPIGKTERCLVKPPWESHTMLFQLAREGTAKVLYYYMKTPPRLR